MDRALAQQLALGGVPQRIVGPRRLELLGAVDVRAGSLRRALVGGNLAAAAAKNGWAGIVVDGAVRDLAELRQAQVGIRALALVPLRTAKRDLGEADIPVQIQGVWVRPGDWLYADEDGIVVSARALHG